MRKESGKSSREGFIRNLPICCNDSNFDHWVKAHAFPALGSTSDLGSKITLAHAEVAMEDVTSVIFTFTSEGARHVLMIKLREGFRGRCVQRRVSHAPATRERGVAANALVVGGSDGSNLSLQPGAHVARGCFPPPLIVTREAASSADQQRQPPSASRLTSLPASHARHDMPTPTSPSRVDVRLQRLLNYSSFMHSYVS